MKKLWILEYKEWIYEDYAYVYRGIRARTLEEADVYGNIIVDYFNHCYDDSDDVENPNFVFVGIINTEEISSFVYTTEQLDEMRKTLAERVENV